ncbi:ANTAR domain-containing protein [Streptomyces sp. NPDC046832]|uniref:ANTAR domain-containing protein n=1 Tax=Streptomyces sp. NPDC046832 TaxID=3155020 RepID=UPI0034032D4B
MNLPHHGSPGPDAVLQPPEPGDLKTKILDLERDNEHLQTAITSHAVIDQAIGVIIALGGLHPEQGFDVLRHVSQHTNIKLRTVADLIVDWVSSKQLPEDVQQALNAALNQARP